MLRTMINNVKAIRPIFKKSGFRFDIGISKSWPAANPTSIIPSQGIGGYPIINNPFFPKGLAPGASSIITSLPNCEVAAVGIIDDKLCKKIMDNPMMRMVLVEAFSSRLSMIKPKPMVAITSKMKTLK